MSPASEPVMISYATSEPSMGSDVAGMQCRATRDGSGNYVLSGTKQWITNANLASFYVVFATVDPALKHKGIGAFIIERSQSGVKPASDMIQLFGGARMPAASRSALSACTMLAGGPA